MISYAEQRREREAERTAGEDGLRDRTLAKVRSLVAENTAVVTTTAAEKAYRAGKVDALKEIERWLEAKR